MTATVNLAPLAKLRFVDNNGVTLAGGKVFTYAAGSTTKQASYTDSTGATPNANPVTLDSRGEASIWLDQTLAYKIVLAPATDTDPPTSPIWTQDGIPAANSTFSAFLIQIATSVGATLMGFLQAGIGAVLRTVAAKLSDTLNANDYGYVADGSWNSTTHTASGTDNLAALNKALAAAVSLGISRVRVQGFGYCSGQVVIPQGVTLIGDGRAGLANFLIGTNRGTVLMINGAAAGDCLSLQENGIGSGLRDLSIYNTNNLAIRSVVAIVGHLYAHAKNVEVACLRKTTGVGWFLKPSANAPNYEPLWGDYDNCYAMISSIGLAGEASVRWGLQLQGLDTTHRPNANSFRAGQFAGTWGGLLADGDVAGAAGLSCVFHGTKFDVIWDGTFTPQFQSAAAKVFGATKASCYIYPIVQLNKSRSFCFDGCYFESAGAPATYNDGTNGSQNLLAVVWLDTAAAITTIDGCNWNNVYLYDSGTWTNCTPTTDQHRHDTRLPVHVNARTTGVQSIPNVTWTNVVATPVFGDDSECEWDATNNQVKIRTPGTYLINAQVEMAGWATASTYATCRVTGSGYTFNGSTNAQQGAGIVITPQVSTTIAMSQGDTLQFQVYHNQGGAQNTSGSNAYVSIIKIG